MSCYENCDCDGPESGPCPCAETREALAGLVARLDEMEKPLTNACVVAHIHGIPYSGPTWADPLDRAKKALGIV
jgi:hypothetical protein